MGLDMEKMKQRKEEMEKDRERNDEDLYLTLEDGTNEVRILPRSMKYFTKEKDDDFALRYWVHYNVFDVPGFKMIVCRKKTLGERCPICEYLAKTGIKAPAKERYSYNAINLKKKDGIIRVLTSGPDIYQKILNYVIHPKCGDVFDITTGRGLTIEKTPAEKSPTGWVNYSIMPDPMPTDVTEMLPEDWQDVLDKLSTRGVPYIFNEEQMEQLCEIHAKGGDPKVVAEGAARSQEKTEAPKEVKTTKAEEKTVQQEKVAEKAAKHQGEMPDCYGEGFSFKDEKCKSCAFRPQCKKVYFETMEKS